MPGAAFSMDSHRLGPAGEAMGQAADSGVRKGTLDDELWEVGPKTPHLHGIGFGEVQFAASSGPCVSGTGVQETSSFLPLLVL